MEIYTIGFTKKSAGEFFGTLKRAGVRRLIDIRLNNTSHLAGFTKQADLPFFLKELCGIEYVHAPLLAPTQDILDSFKKRKGSWKEYERDFINLMIERRIEEKLKPDFFAGPAVLLCSEPTAEHCHRRLVLEYLGNKWGHMDMVHL